MNGAERKPIILAIDDDPVILNSLLSILGALYDTRPVKSADAALGYLARYSADLILLDCNMPGMDGFEFMEKLKSSGATRDIPVIFLTGSDDPADEAKALASGASDFILKPVKPALLLARVAAALK